MSAPTETYLRAYLNDKSTDDTDGTDVTPSVVSETALSSYLRNYLNDVV